MTEITLIQAYYQKLKQTPLKFWIVGGVVFLVIIFAFAFFTPKQITFSYAQRSCANQLLIAPALQHQSGDSSVVMRPQGGVSVGGSWIFSTEICVEPSSEFVTGLQDIKMSLGGGRFMAKHLRVIVPDPPTVLSSSTTSKPISAVRPLEVKLTSPDIIHTYSIRNDEKSADCTTSQQLLSCNIKDLDLEHGRDYKLSLDRAIDSKVRAREVTELSIATLTPVQITQTSITNNQTVYETIEEMSFATDKPLVSAEAAVFRLDEAGVASVDGQKATAIEAEVQLDEQSGKLTFKEELTRKSTYIVRFSQLDAKDGSSLAETFTLRFSTSGGPKVSGASVGASLVPQNARIILTFDQPIDQSVDVAKHIRLEGVAGSVARQSDNQVTISLQNTPLCAAFSITVEKGIKSASNGTDSDQDWRLDSRIICGTSSVIGHSVQGRPIIAYYFGSGGSTILFTAGIHGSEPSSTSTMQAWVNYLQSNGHIVPAGKRVVVVPSTNPDGIAAGSRNNARNVNLGRNFPSANWKASIETASGTLPEGGGASPGSEPEAQALMSLTRQLRPRLEVSFHAQGRLVGANKVADSVSIGNIYAGIVGYGTMYYNAEAVMGYEMTGEYEEWMGEEMGIPAILIELPTHSGNYLNSQLKAIMRMLSV